jgi:hypothetical protein
LPLQKYERSILGVHVEELMFHSSLHSSPQSLDLYNEASHGRSHKRGDIMPKCLIEGNVSPQASVLCPRFDRIIVQISRERRQKPLR